MRALTAKSAITDLARLLFALALFVLLGTANAQVTITLTQPSNNSTSPVNSPINLAASVTGTVNRVKFRQNGSVITALGDNQAPFTDVFTPTTAGQYVFTAEAVQSGVVVATSTSVTVNVGGSNTPPTVTLASSASTGAAPASFVLTATATDADGTVSSVKFYDGSSLANTDTTAPYSFTLVTSVTGTHSLTAVVTDNAGATSTSSPVPVTVTASSGGPVSITRTYVYDSQQRLCKSIDPEIGATLMDYDAAGNVAWVATSTTLTSNTCDREMVGLDLRTVRSYDKMNRVIGISTPGGTADVTLAYTPDGLVGRLVAANGAAGANPVTTSYTYNKRRLIASESSSQAMYSYGLAYGYDANGYPSSITYPDLQVVTYSSDGLGRVKEVKAGSQVYATGVTYLPNGAIGAFSYGNGVVHSMTPNDRMLPGRSVDSKTLSGVTTKFIDDAFSYDRNGNVTDITDQAQAGLTTRGMAYDGLDRLTAAVSPAQWGNGTYAYDALDNIRAATQQFPSRSFNYSYDVVTNRLATVGGSSAYSFRYDERGNVIGKGSQDFTFDSSNRMTTAELVGSASLQSYRYDGAGRRVQVTDAGGQINLWVYNVSGQVVYNHDERRGQNLAYVYLGNSLVATRAVDYSHTGEVAIRFQHTDALGSPVAETGPADANGNVSVLKRNSYTAYGETYGATSVDGTGFGGHVMDRDTGMVYMQQRYYDPAMGRFLTIDPASDDFTRYAYARNNPYKFSDPDGRRAVPEIDLKSESEVMEEAYERFEASKNETRGEIQFQPWMLRTVTTDELEMEARCKGPPPRGIVYGRIDPRTGEYYVGQAISPERYDARQGEHDLLLGVKHDFDILDYGEPGEDLDVAEETQIRERGGPRRQGGTLANKRYQMNQQRFEAAGGRASKPTPPTRSRTPSRAPRESTKPPERVKPHNNV